MNNIIKSIDELKEKQAKELQDTIKFNEVVNTIVSNPLFKSLITIEQIKTFTKHAAYADCAIHIERESLQSAIELAEKMNPLTIYRFKDGCLSFKPEKYMQKGFNKYPNESLSRNDYGWTIAGCYYYEIEGLKEYKENKKLNWYVAIDDYIVKMVCNVLNDKDTYRTWRMSGKNEQGNSIARNSVNLVNQSGYFTHVDKYWSTDDQPNTFIVY